MPDLEEIGWDHPIVPGPVNQTMLGSNMFHPFSSPLTNDRLILTPAEFGALFGRSKTWAYRMIYRGVIRPLKSTPSVMIPRSEVDRLLADTAEYDGRPAVKYRSAATKKTSARRATATPIAK